VRDAAQGSYDGDAGVLDVVDAGLLGQPAPFRRNDVELQPHSRRADGDGLTDDVGRVGRGAEHVDQIDRLRDIGETPVGPLTEDLVGVGIDRDDAPSVALYLGRHRVGRLAAVA
jgi:hypothetical protein